MEKSVAIALRQIAMSTNPVELKGWMDNAKKLNKHEVFDAAFRRLISIVPSEEPGTVDYDFWQAVNALELTLTQERGKTTRLSRTRQKVKRVGVVATLADWALSSNETQGFQMLVERGMAELTGEAIVLRYPSVFSTEAQDAARERLSKAGVAM